MAYCAVSTQVVVCVREVQMLCVRTWFRQEEPQNKEGTSVPAQSEDKWYKEKESPADLLPILTFKEYKKSSFRHIAHEAGFIMGRGATWICIQQMRKDNKDSNERDDRNAMT